MQTEVSTAGAGTTTREVGEALPISLTAVAPLCTGLVVIYALLIPLHLGGLEGRARIAMVITDAVLALTFLGQRLLIGRGGLSAPQVRLLAACNIALPYLSLLLLWTLKPNPLQIGFVLVILMGCGAFLLSSWWFGVSIATISVSWVALVSATMVPTPDRPQLAAVLLAAAALATAVFVSRRSNLRTLKAALSRAARELDRREATERTLRASESQLELAIEGSRGGWWTFEVAPGSSARVTRTYLSAPLKKLIGFSEDELPNSLEAWRERVVEEDREQLERSMRDHLAGALPEHRVKYRIRHKSGEIRWLETLGRVERDAAGKPTRFSGMDRDITDSVTRERTLEVLSRAVEQSSSIVLITDPAGDLTYVNPKFTEVTGYQTAEVLGRNPRFLKSGETPRDVYSDLWQKIKRGKPWHGELKNKTKSGEFFWVLASISPMIDDAGNVINYVGVQENITLRKQAEEHLLKSQRLEAIGRLVSGVAHDFNNLLTSILGFSEIATAELGPDSASCRPYLEQVISAGETATSLTRQLLAVGRQQVLRPRTIDLNAEVVKTRELLSRTLGENIEVVMNLDPEIGPILVDPGQLQQVLLNLAINARDAMPSGGVLTFETSNAELDETYLGSHPGAAAGAFVLLAISDSGCGMDEETLGQIFEPFFTTKKSVQGTGLGLATTYGIIKQSGGYIWAYSELHRGSTFKIYMPRQAHSVVAARRETHQSGVKGDETILLVEDEQRVRQLLQSLLTSHGYTVLSASSSNEAMEIAAQPDLQIDLLVSDLVLPTETGLQLAEQLHRQRATLKVLLITGYAEQALRRELEPAFPLLTKPFTMQNFARSVRQILDGEGVRAQGRSERSR